MRSYHNETGEEKQARSDRNYEELKSFDTELNAAFKAGSPAFKEFLTWMIDVYAASECGRYSGGRSPYGYLIRQGLNEKTSR